MIPDELLIRNTITYGTFESGYTVNTLNVSHSCWGEDIFLLGGETPIYNTSLFYWNQDGTPASDFFLKSPTCPGTFFAGWGEIPGDPNPGNFSHPYAPDNQTEYVVMSCSSNLEVSEVSAVVDGKDIVLSYDIFKSLPQSEGKAFFGWDNTTDPTVDFDTSFQSAIAAFLTRDGEWKVSGSILRVGSDNTFLSPYTLRWINYLMVEKNPLVRRHLTNVTHIPDKENVVQAFTGVYKALYSINLQLYSDKYIDFGTIEKTIGTSFVSKERVTLSRSMFGMAIGILAYFLIVIIYVYWSRPGANLSHMPIILVATHTLLYASNALEDCARL